MVTTPNALPNSRLNQGPQDGGNGVGRGRGRVLRALEPHNSGREARSPEPFSKGSPNKNADFS